MIRNLCLGLLALALPGSAAAQPVFLRLQAALDAPDHFCMDLLGHGPSVNLDGPIQGHSCKEGWPQEDQQVDAEKAKAGVLFLPSYGRCLVADRGGGATVTPRTCNGAAAQRWSWGEAGTLSPAADPSLCLTLGAGPSTVAGAPPGVAWLMRPLTIERCSAAAASRQQWSLEAGKLPIRR